jgi:hypothetical protein
MNSPFRSIKLQDLTEIKEEKDKPCLLEKIFKGLNIVHQQEVL